ncbi:interferon-inducible GTPase-domain-containing protein [Fomitopsis betulina]|nr:interferon-inducible GTPase-domain-containing protein [Fomitopsis betulina]
MGGSGSKIRGLEERVARQEEHLAESMRQQQQTLDMLKGATDAQKQATDALNRAEAVACEQQDLIRQVNEAKQQAEETARRSEERTNELRDAMQRLEQEIRNANEGRAEAEAEAQKAREQERAARAAQEEAERTAKAAREAQEEAEQNLRNGIRPIIVPTQAQLEATKRRLGYRQGFFHFAVAGISGSGKSSMINSFRGLRNRDPGAAQTGVVETTSEVVRYPDPSTDMPYVWYDVPGAGTLNIPDWQYFTDQGLYIFNCIIVVIDSRFTATDIAILRNCVRFQIPSFIVRSKSKQHITNIANDMGGDQDDEDDEEDRRTRLARARERYIRDTRDNFARNLEDAGLLAQKVYLVDKDILVKTVKGRSSADAIDEDNLLRDMFALAERPEEFTVNG